MKNIFPSLKGHRKGAFLHVPQKRVPYGTRRPFSYPPPPPSSSTSSSSSVCGARGIAQNALQPFEAYCASSGFSFPVHLQRGSTSERRERPLVAKGRIMGEKLFCV
jgi:hypothetical protein